MARHKGYSRNMTTYPIFMLAWHTLLVPLLVVVQAKRFSGRDQDPRVFQSMNVRFSTHV